MRQRVTKHIYYLHKYTMERYTKSKGVYLKKKLAHKGHMEDQYFSLCTLFFHESSMPYQNYDI